MGVSIKGDLFLKRHAMPNITIGYFKMNGEFLTER